MLALALPVQENHRPLTSAHAPTLPLAFLHLARCHRHLTASASRRSVHLLLLGSYRTGCLPKLVSLAVVVIRAGRRLSEQGRGAWEDVDGRTTRLSSAQESWDQFDVRRTLPQDPRQAHVA